MLHHKSLQDADYMAVRHTSFFNVHGENNRKGCSTSLLRGAMAMRLCMGMAAALLLLLNIGMLRAQQWEYVYGDNETTQIGQLRVVPVTGTCASPDCCAGTDGYIAVGTTTYANQLEDVYVVRTDNNGAKIWEYTYDLTGNGYAEFGYSIIEPSDGSGFMITGDMIFAGVTYYAFLLKIDCDGAPLWSKRYGAATIQTGAHDLIEAKTGNSAVGTNAGDIVVCGREVHSGTADNGLLFRTTSAGVMIWNTTFDERPNPAVVDPAYNEVFFALTEATPIAPSTTGDIIAVGWAWIAPATQKNAYVVRVDGNGGIVAGVPQGSAIYGSANDDIFFSVIELQNPNQKGTSGRPNVVICGLYNTTDIYAVKLNGGDPCSPLVERSIRTGTTGDQQFGTMIREIPFSTSTYSGDASQWDIVMTGVYIPAGQQSEMFLLSLASGNLAPGALNGRYGGSGTEEGWSLYPVDEVGDRTFGFILCGWTTTDWDCNGDPKDMYLVKTDGYGETGCENEYQVQSASFTGVTCGDPKIASPMTTNDLSPVETSRDWGLEICPRPMCKSTPSIGSQSDRFRYMPGSSFEPLGPTLYPNPIKSGGTLRVIAPGEDEGTISVTDMLGKAVMPETSFTRNSDGEIILKTGDWNAGVYLVTVRAGTVQSTVRAIIE